MAVGESWDYFTAEGVTDPATAEMDEFMREIGALNSGRIATVLSVEGPSDDDELGGGLARLKPITPSGNGGESKPIGDDYDSTDIREFAHAA